MELQWYATTEGGLPQVDVGQVLLARHLHVSGFEWIYQNSPCTPLRYSCLFSLTRRYGNSQVQHRCCSADRSRNSPMQSSTRNPSCALAVPQ